MVIAAHVIGFNLAKNTTTESVERKINFIFAGIKSFYSLTSFNFPVALFNIVDFSQVLDDQRIVLSINSFTERSMDLYKTKITVYETCFYMVFSDAVNTWYQKCK